MMNKPEMYSMKKNELIKIMKRSLSVDSYKHTAQAMYLMIGILVGVLTVGIIGVEVCGRWLFSDVGVPLMLLGTPIIFIFFSRKYIREQVYYWVPLASVIPVLLFGKVNLSNDVAAWYLLVVLVVSVGFIVKPNFEALKVKFGFTNLLFIFVGFWVLLTVIWFYNVSTSSYRYASMRFLDSMWLCAIVFPLASYWRSLRALPAYFMLIMCILSLDSINNCILTRMEIT